MLRGCFHDGPFFWIVSYFSLFESGLTGSGTSTSWILVLLMPQEVSRNFMMPLLADFVRAERLLQSFSVIEKQNHYGYEQLY